MRRDKQARRDLPKRRNVIAQAHSLRGPAGSGPHLEVEEPIRAGYCECGCPLDDSGACVECDDALAEWAADEGPDRLFSRRGRR